jgi:fructoselysine 6-kinase
MREVKITAMSTICADVFDGTNEIRLGGEALNFAMQSCNYPHIRMSIIAGIGDDEIGQHAIRCIEQKDIDRSCVHIIKGGTTASNRIYLTNEGERYFKSASWNGGVYQDFTLSDIDRKKLSVSDIVFINYYSPNFQEVLNLKDEYGYQMAVDFDVVRNFGELEQIVSKIDYVFFSGDEEMLPVLQEWSKKYQGIFNATLAEKGSVSYHRGKEYCVKAVPVDCIVDTTGCGDSYHAGFLASFVRDKDIVLAMNKGSEIASKTLSYIGGFM